MLHQNPSVFRRSILIASALLASAVFSAARAAQPEVLARLPADAYGLVVINNVRTLSNKISNAATRLNLSIPPDLVGYATRTIGINKGFDPNSSAALILLKPTPERLAQGYFSDMPPAVLLIPTTDPKLMLEPFQPGDPDKTGISQVNLPDNPGEKGFIAVVDNKWVALAQNREDLAAYLARTDSFAAKASAETRRIFDVNDLVVWGNVPKLSAGFEKNIDDAQTEIGGMLDLANVSNNQDPIAGTVQKQVLTMGFAFFKQFLRDSDASMMTLRLTDSGATFGLVGDFKADSTIGKFVASQKGKPVNLQGLPAGPAGAAGGSFLAAGSFNWDSASMATIMANFTNQLLADDTIAKDPRAADLKKSLDLQQQVFAIVSGGRFIVFDPPGNGQNGFINGACIIDTTDPAKLKQLQLESLNSVLMRDPMNPDFKQTVTTTPDALTVKGVSFSKMNMKIALREETPDKPISPANRMAFQMVQRIYGPDGITAYFGLLGKKALVVYGSDQANLEAAVAAAQADTDVLSANPTIAATKDQLVANPIAVAYLPITRWVTLAASLLRPTPLEAVAPVNQAIANAPPVVFSAGVTGSMMTAEIHLPIATVQGTQEAVRTLQRSLMGGMQGGGNLP